MDDGDREIDEIDYGNWLKELLMMRTCGQLET